MLIPIVEKTSALKGWLVYDSRKGEIVIPVDFPDTDGLFPGLNEAKDWVNRNFYPGENTKN